MKKLGFILFFAATSLNAQDIFYSAKDWDGRCECPKAINLDSDSLIYFFLGTDSTNGFTTEEVFSSWIIKGYLEFIEFYNSTFLDRNAYRIGERYQENWLLDIWLENDSAQILYKVADFSNNSNRKGLGVYRLTVPLKMWNLLDSVISDLEIEGIRKIEDTKAQKYEGAKLKDELRRETPNKGATYNHGPFFFIEIKIQEIHKVQQFDGSDIDFMESVIPWVRLIQFLIPEVDCKFNRRECPESFYENNK